MMFDLDKYQSQAVQTSSEIAKSIKQNFAGVSRPFYEGDKKVRQRTDTNLLYHRSENEWKCTLDRRNKQKAEGFFSPALQPYDELGRTELITKDLLVNAMTDIGMVFRNQESKVADDVKKEADKQEWPKKKSVMEKYAKESSMQRASNSTEINDCGSLIIKDLVDKAHDRIRSIKAGQTLSSCLQDQTEQEKRFSKTENENCDRKPKTGGIYFQLPNEFCEEHTSTDETAGTKRWQQNRIRKAFVAKLECLEMIFQCVLNTRNKDLRRKVPLSRKALHAIRHSFDTGEGPHLSHGTGVGRMPRLSAIPAVIFSSNRNHRLQQSAMHLNDSELMPAMHLQHGSSNLSDYTNSISSKMQLGAANCSDAVPIKNGVHASTLHSSQPIGNQGCLRMDTWEDLMAMQSDVLKSDASVVDADVARGASKQINFSNVIRLLKPRRGAVFQSKGNLDLPIWQRVIQDEIKREELKAGRKVKEFTKKKVVDGEKMLEEIREAFTKIKHTNLDKLERELHTKVNCHEQRMNYLRVSLLSEADVKHMRSGVKQWQASLVGDNVNVRLVKWYESLRDEQRSLGLEWDDRVTLKLRNLMKFIKIEVSSICNLKFFLSSIMEISPNYIEDWMLNRKLVTSNISAK
eukprot:gene20156-22130_t